MHNPIPRARRTLVAAILFSTFTIWAVHYQQEQERENMYQGVLRDDERRREKMRQRQAEFDESKRKRETYERVQAVEKSDE
ncbi:cytochrome c oxidase assembly protein [Moniliophthora roreri MCA 2997]|uniref:Cytochrome c oxidase assembly protein n=1 Tax=Moniliophthora roreri (strain MCA 2997) TaxID=1381753 RepID=V2X7I7_MONRO|nr:cytochrome c oxidase assembly protein [Moniliophthora roreri MCA 2997]KAI3616693.1 cytochrome c oxidase assembly protein [Moniliophthora roreri]